MPSSNREDSIKNKLKSSYWTRLFTTKILIKNTVKDCQEAMTIIKECGNIIKTYKKKIISFAYEQDKNLRKIQNLKISLNNSAIVQ